MVVLKLRKDDTTPLWCEYSICNFTPIINLMEGNVLRQFRGYTVGVALYYSVDISEPV